MVDSGEREQQSSGHLLPQRTEDVSSDHGERFNWLRNSLMNFTERCFAPARLEKISACLQDIRSKNPEAFDSIIQQLIHSLKSNVKQELELMIKQENLVSLCHNLDEITAKSEEAKFSWRPSGKPSKDIMDHIMFAKVEFREKLRQNLKQLQDENKTMQENIMSMRKEVTGIEERIQKKQEELQKAAEVCDKLEGSNNNDGKESLERMIVDLQGQ